MVDPVPDILVAQNVGKTFGQPPSQFVALADVDVRIKRGEFVAIVGPSGSGKSTLLHILAGLEAPTAGSVLLEGVDLALLDETARTILRRRRIGFVFQRINLLPNLTALENVTLPLLIDGVRPAERNDRACAMIDLVGMAHRLNSFPATLSGGEQQRIAIARALVSQPAVILADEPTGALDTANGQLIVKLLHRLVRHEGQTVVVVTHDPTFAGEADRMISMRDGCLASHSPWDTPSALLPEPKAVG